MVFSFVLRREHWLGAIAFRLLVGLPLGSLTYTVNTVKIARLNKKNEVDGKVAFMSFVWIAFLFAYCPFVFPSDHPSLSPSLLLKVVVFPRGAKEQKPSRIIFTCNTKLRGDG